MNFKLFCIIFEISIMLIINFLAKKNKYYVYLLCKTHIDKIYSIS